MDFLRYFSCKEKTVCFFAFSRFILCLDACTKRSYRKQQSVLQINGNSSIVSLYVPIGSEELWSTALRFGRMLCGQTWTRRMLPFPDLFPVPFPSLEMDPVSPSCTLHTVLWGPLCSTGCREKRASGVQGFIAELV